MSLPTQTYIKTYVITRDVSISNQSVTEKPSIDFFPPVHLTGFFFAPHVVEQTPRIISRVSDTLPARSLSAYCVIFQDKLWDVWRVPQMHTVQKPMHTAPFLVHWSYVFFFVCLFFFCAAHLLVHGL